MSSHSIQSVSRAISKRTSLDAVIQFATSPDFRLEKTLTKELMASVSKNELKKIEQKIKPRYNDKRRLGIKFLRINRWMPVAVQRTIKLELHKTTPKRILDLGCGTGYFMAAARRLGHDVIGIDLDDVEVFNDLMDMLKLTKVVYRINAFEPLPDMGMPFDMITAFMVKFNMLGVNEHEHWGFEEWRYFLDDCRSRLNPGGQIYLSLNKGKRDDFDFLSDETAARIREYPGAKLSGNKAFLRVQT